MKRGCRAMSNSGRPIGLRRFWRVDAREDRHRDQRHQRLHHEGEGEQIGRPDVHGPLHELRTEHAGEHAAGHHPGHCLGTERGARAVSCRKTIGLRHRAIEAAKEGRDAEQDERAAQNGERAEQSGQRAAPGTGDEGDPAAVATRDRAGGQRARRHPEHIHRQRHGGERHAWRDGRADDRAGGKNHGGIGAGQRLRRREPHHIGAGARVVGRLLAGSYIDHRRSRPCTPMARGRAGRR
jgi:hypothetical protein